MEKNKNRETEEKREKRITPGFWVVYAAVIFAMLAVFAFGMVTSLISQRDLTARKAELESSISEEKQRNSELSMEGDYYKSDEYYEKIAREKLGLVMPNEITFIDQNK